jgi:competence protein ComEC
VTAGIGVAWRYAALAGLAAGLAVAPVAAQARVQPALLLAVACLLAVVRPRGRGAAPWLVLVAGVALLAGLTLGNARLAAIDTGALTPGEGERLRARGAVASTPRVVSGVTRFVLEVDGSRIAVESRASVSGVDEGRVVVVHGTARPPAPWLAGALARDGAAMVVDADVVRATDAVRGGLRGALDGVRRRAESALERGTPEASAALLRGFVLGQDDRIPESVRDEFRRSGLAHVLAVSGQNVMLLALLATPILALTGASLRLRLLCLAALIAVYVPVAGAGPSIQRAGVMGAAGLVAALAGRPSARWYALLLAAVATLALDPRSTGDIGWQLSFAAVAGLLVLVAPLVRVLGGARTLARRTLAEGAAMTLAATLATAPLAAHHFGTVSLTAIPANLVALPAIAPAMWLGMLAGAVGQIPGAPVEPLTSLGGLCAAFIGWTARAFGGDWAQIEFAEPALGTAIALTVALLLGARLACAALERRQALRPGWGGRVGSRRLAAAALATALALTLVVVLPGGLRPAGPPPGLRMRVLDVGQGDAILLEPRDALPVLVDTGPPGGGAAERLDELGIDRLGALAVTHDELDHSGALGEVLARVEAERIVHTPGARPRYCAGGACPGARALGAGQSLRAGRLRLDVLWPREGALGDDRNASSLVLRVRLGGFEALLTGDAEAEVAPIDPGPVDVLKVAHHGSADAGLPGLLERAAPRLAVISVGDDNPYGHPAPETLTALAERGVSARRTDERGEVVIEVRGDGWTVG